MVNDSERLAPVALRTTPLPTSWTLRLDAGADDPKLSDAERAMARRVIAAGPVPATVPGCVHTDLLAADLIPDPFHGENELAARWIGRCDWTYTTTLRLGGADVAAEHLEVAFDGLDTLATVRLNGRVVGTSANMHVRCRFDLGPHARAGDNELSVTFAAPLPHTERLEATMGGLPTAGCGTNPPVNFQMIRKMACNFGWDWGPQLVTSGIWRPGRIEAWGAGRIADVRPLVSAAGEDRAEVAVHVDVEGRGEIVASVKSPEGEVVAQGRGASPVVLVVDRPQRWWPVGYGGQPLYRLDVALVEGEITLDAATRQVGLRTVELVTTPDPEPVDGLGQGETFHLKVNGRRVFCKGANWISDDPFPHRVTPDRYRERIDQALGANMNMLRVWGGGLYEDAAFFEHCDRTGMMVWQDFAFACACYPEEAPFDTLVEAEARDNVARLACHPSLVLWNGCNENIWATFQWSGGWIPIREEGVRTWGLGFYLDLFPRVIADLDPSRPYWPGSPYSGTMDRHPNLNEFGNRHIWDVWNGHGDYRNYLGHFPRFASEFGFQGPPTWPTLRASIPPDQRDWLSPAMQHHNKQPHGQQRALDRIADDFRPPSDFDETWFLASVNQARAIRLGCEWFRALSPWCGGALYWQLNDCWPVTSWAAIDGAGRPKLLLDATRRFFRPRLVTIMPAAPGSADLAVYLHNDADEPWHATVRTRRANVGGDVLDAREDAVVVPPREVAKIPLAPTAGAAADELLIAQVDGESLEDRAWWFFGKDRDVPPVRPDFEVNVREHDGAAVVGVTTRHLVRDLCLLVDRLSPDATATPQAVTLLPGESTTFRVDGLSPEDLRSADLRRLLRSPSLQTEGQTSC